jgi:hypothetical protein
MFRRCLFAQRSAIALRLTTTFNMLVCHGWQNIGDDEATIVSMPSRLYDYDARSLGFVVGFS